MPPTPHRITPPAASAAPVIAHVPHASIEIPPEYRAQIDLDDADLACELVRLTDWHAEALFSWVPRHGGWLFANRLSRLVFDPERFRSDADEPMAAAGQGVVYTHTTDGRRFATLSADERERRVRELYDPYQAALTGLARERLEQFGGVLILDCHSFASRALPSEPDQSPDRPDICIGTDAFHTPPELAERLVSGFDAEGLTVAVDRPFAGTLVPLEFWHAEARVHSVMIEVRRGLYCDEATGMRNEQFEAMRDAVERVAVGALDG